MILSLLPLLPLALAASSPDWYPTPEIGTVKYNEDWSHALNKSMDILSQMTLPEKVNITTGQGWTAGVCVGNTGGVPRLGVKGLCLQDGPLGVAQTDFVNVFPCGIAMAATFDRALVNQRGAAIGRQSRLKGVDVHLGPCVGPLGRHVAAGRNWEGFSSDPYLAGKLAYEAVQGVQGENVLATIKHLVGNEQEHYRRVQEWVEVFNFTDLKAPLSSNIDDRTLHEAYLWPFADAVKAGVAAVMCSYNDVNGTQACQNSDLINGKLKSELGFQGFVMSDWFAQGSGVSNALAGLDLSMPGNDIDGTIFWGEELTRMVNNGTLPELRLDDMVLRILTPLIYHGIDDRVPNFASFDDGTFGAGHMALDPDAKPDTLVNYHVDVRDRFTNKVALEGARDTIVLLENDGILPLKTQKKIGVFGIGSLTDPAGAKCGQNMQCSNGALIEGWGSGTAYPTEFQSPYEALHKRAEKENIHVSGTSDSWDLTLPKILAQKTDVNIVYVIANSGEATGIVDGNLGDRNNISLWHNGDALIDAVASQGKTVVVVTTVGPVDMSAWLHHANISAILWTGPAGDFGSQAMAEVVFGDVNPSGKLPYTIASDLNDYIPIVDKIPADGRPQSNFDEGVYIDYKWYDKHNKTPLYEFGYGLSYSNFTFEDLELSLGAVSELLPPRPKPEEITKPKSNKTSESDLHMPSDFSPIKGLVYPWLQTSNTSAPYTFANGAGHISEASGGVGGNPWLWTTVGSVSHTTRNVGSAAGRVVSQLYISFPNTCVDSPKVQLRGFEKSRLLDAGEFQVTKYDLNWRDLAIWDVTLQSWRVQRGEYKIWIGHSSRKMDLWETFTL